MSEKVGPLDDLLTKALAWAFWSIGEGMVGDGTVEAPEDFFWDYSKATDDEDWETYVDRLVCEYRLASIAAVEAERDALVEALREIERRTGLLLHQNTGRWNMRVEHDKRTVDVLTVNQSIADAALASVGASERE